MMTWRSIPLMLVVAFGTFICSSLAILFSRFRNGERMVQKVSQAWARPFFKVANAPCTVHHGERIPEHPGYIIMANHKSHLDPPLIIAQIPHHIRFLAKIELFSIPVFGTAMEAVGHIAIDRRNHEAAVRSLKLAGQKIRNGTTILAFPEGTRYAPEGLGPLKKGSFHLALESGVPILPIWIEGTEKVLAKGSLAVHPHPIQLYIGEPIDATTVQSSDLAGLISKVKSRLNSLHEEALQDVA